MEQAKSPFDLLTGLPNNPMFQLSLEHSLANAERYELKSAVIIIGLDNFTKINKQLGDKVADQLLKNIASRLRHRIRRSDMLARLTDHEFAVLLTQLPNSHDSAMIAEDVFDLLTHPFQMNGHEISVGASIGISIYPNDGVNGDAMLRCAYAAMHAAKAHGENKYQIYNSELSTQSGMHLSLCEDLTKALENDELALDYQPQINARTNKVVGVEALIRWTHEKRGVVSPNEFIPVAEEEGLIVPLTEWVLRSACKQLKRWHDSGVSDLQISINISARMFDQLNFVEKVLGIINESKVSPEHIMLEITESVIMKHPKEAAETLKQLREHGIHIALDDFGTGYSSMTYLKNFVTDALKIDKSFIEDLLVDEDTSNIVKAVIMLANSLHMKFIAEGVKTDEQKEFLLENGCEVIQGFLYSEPLSADECTQYLLSQESRIT